MNIEKIIQQAASDAITKLYGEVAPALVQIQKTRKEFSGDYTLVVFPLLKTSHKAPEATAVEIGEQIKADCPLVAGYNVIKGFLNIELNASFWAEQFEEIRSTEEFGKAASTGKTVMIEYSAFLILFIDYLF